MIYGSLIRLIVPKVQAKPYTHLPLITQMVYIFHLQVLYAFLLTVGYLKALLRSGQPLISLRDISANVPATRQLLAIQPKHTIVCESTLSR